MTLGLIDILKLAGFDPAPTTKLVRHTEPHYAKLEELLRNDWLELYQSYQGKPRFDHAKQIITFYGLSGTRAMFYGVYKVLSRRPAKDGLTPTSCPWSREWNRKSKFFYELKRDPKFDELRGRMIINWGANPIAWVQKLGNKSLLEILPPGRKLVLFDDYLEFSLAYTELKDLFGNEEAHRDWRTPLAAVAGVYLILAQKTGHLYVGSAYGANGIWGRWRKYATSGDGGNNKLRELIRSDPAYPDKFRFSLLQILPQTMTRDEVIKRETLYKNKLGTRATGLNSN